MEITVLRDRPEKQFLKQAAQDIPFFNAENLDHRSFIAAVEGHQVLGLVAFVEDSARIPGAIGVGYVSVSPDARQRGIAKLLVGRLFELAEHDGKDIANTSYEPDGELYLRHIFARHAKSFPSIKLHER